MSRAKKVTPPRFPEFRNAFLELMGDMTLEQFAKKLSMSRATVGFYAAGQRIPDALGLKKIAEKCNVSTDWLLGLSNYPNYDDRGITAEELGMTGEAAQSIRNLWENIYKGVPIAKYYKKIWNLFLTSADFFLILDSVARYVRKVSRFEQVIKAKDFPIKYNDKERDWIKDETARQEYIKHNSNFAYSYEAFSVQRSVMAFVDCAAKRLASEENE